jgi:predicted outer membrane lipoprotein
MATRHIDRAGTNWREFRLVIILGLVIGTAFGIVTHAFSPEPVIVMAKSKTRL